jgi:hypothetical protein
MREERMSTNRGSQTGQQPGEQSNMIKDPNEWTTGDEPMNRELVVGIVGRPAVHGAYK